MEEVREKARYYISNGVIKTEGIKKLKKEFKIPERTILTLWWEEKENLKKRVSKANTTKNKRELIYDKAIKENGVELQLTVAIEELAELQQALCKYKRGEEHNVEEEIADVKIMIEQLEMLFNKKDIERWRNKKVARLQERLRV